MNPVLAVLIFAGFVAVVWFAQSGINRGVDAVNQRVRSATPETDAMELAQAFVRDGLPAGNLASQTATDDPNKLLGQPGKYTQRVSFDLPGGSSTAGAGDIDRGAVIEWWPNPADAQVRADYIQAALSASSDLRTEYDLVGGNALLRISGRIAPDLAGQFEAALKRRA